MNTTSHTHRGRNSIRFVVAAVLITIAGAVWAISGSFFDSDKPYTPSAARQIEPADAMAASAEHVASDVAAEQFATDDQQAGDSQDDATPKHATPEHPSPDATTTEDEEIPPALTHYMGREIATTMHWMGAEWLTRETRDAEEHTSKVVEELKLEPGMTVCDLGCGNGYYTLKLAEAVAPEGKVLAVEIQEEYFGMLEQRAREAEIDNIDLVLGTIVNPNLPARSCDVVLLVDVYHEFSHPVQMLANIRKALKPDGVMVLVEFRAEDPDVPIKPEHKMSKSQILKEIPANGYKLVGEFNGLPWQHMMFFARDDSELEEVEPVDAF